MRYSRQNHFRPKIDSQEADAGQIDVIVRAWEVATRQTTVQLAVCIIILACTLTAGLWPFRSPQNAVFWPFHANGLNFWHDGIALSTRAFEDPDPNGRGERSLEVWLQPTHVGDTSTFLAFSRPERPLVFALRQAHAGLFESEVLYERGHAGRGRTLLENVFHQNQPAVITITSAEEGAATYLNGVLIRTSSEFRFSGADLSGQLLIGTSPVNPDGWVGRFHGLAIYDVALTGAQVQRHYVAWTTSGTPDATESEKPTAIYLFKEQGGRLIHNEIRTAPDLYIPDKLFVPHKSFLEAFWNEFAWDQRYWKNVAINIAGFMPLGFVVAAFLLSVHRRAVTACTLIVGLAISLTIEVLQGYLPSRASGTTDLITNTLGTWLGVRCLSWSVARRLYFATLSVPSLLLPAHNTSLRQ